MSLFPERLGVAEHRVQLRVFEEPEPWQDMSIRVFRMTWVRAKRVKGAKRMDLSNSLKSSSAYLLMPMISASTSTRPWLTLMCKRGGFTISQTYWRASTLSKGTKRTMSDGLPQLPTRSFAREPWKAQPLTKSKPKCTSISPRTKITEPNLTSEDFLEGMARRKQGNR